MNRQSLAFVTDARIKPNVRMRRLNALLEASAEKRMEQEKADRIEQDARLKQERELLDQRKAAADLDALERSLAQIEG